MIVFLKPTNTRNNIVVKQKKNDTKGQVYANEPCKFTAYGEFETYSNFILTRI